MVPQQQCFSISFAVIQVQESTRRINFQMSFGNIVPKHCFLMKSVSAVRPTDCEEEKQEILPGIFSKGMFDPSNSLLGMPLGFSACIFCEIEL